MLQNDCIQKKKGGVLTLLGSLVRECPDPAESFHFPSDVPGSVIGRSWFFQRRNCRVKLNSTTLFFSSRDQQILTVFAGGQPYVQRLVYALTEKLLSLVDGTNADHAALTCEVRSVSLAH